MTVDYKYVNGTQVAVICDLENANLTAEEWKQFGNMIIQRFEDMLPTVTIVGVEQVQGCAACPRNSWQALGNGRKKD